MKKIIFLILVLLVSCNENSVEQTPEPSVDIISFNPAKLYLYPETDDANIVFKGTDFTKYIIDSVFIDNVRLTIVGKEKDSLITTLNQDLIGNFRSLFFIKG